MDEMKEISSVLERMEKTARQQMKLARWQCLFSALAAVFCGCVLAAVLMLLPQLRAITQEAGAVLQDARQVSSQLAQADWEGLTADLEQVSKQMAQADLDGVVDEVSSLVQTSQEGLSEALGKLNSIDFDTLNKAITDLANVVEPLARFFGRL